MKKLLLVYICVLVPVSEMNRVYPADYDTGTVNLSGKLQLDYYYHRLGDNWSASGAGYKDTNYNYSLNNTTPSTPSWSGSFGQTLFLDIGIKPYENITGEFGFEFISNYADRYWIPLNFEHRMKEDNINAFWKKGDVKYEGDGLSLRYFRGVGHYHWGYEGDMFNLYYEQYETDKYLRLSGRPSPEGIEINLAGDAGNLNVIHGPEILWNHKNGTYAKYNVFLGGIETFLIYAGHIIPYGEPDETMRSFEVSTKFNFIDRPAAVGALYRSFRLNRAYYYVEDAPAGAGDLGSNYLKKSGTTSSGDATGVSFQYDLLPKPFLNSMLFKYTRQGLVAGNKQEYSVQMNRSFSRSMTGSLLVSWRRPLLGPIPLVYEGTAANPGPVLFEPRGPQSPFWVNWENREANTVTTVFTFDPTPGTWFYLFQPDQPDSWNLNPAENAPVSFAARYTMSKYATATDRQYYFDGDGKVVWEPPLSAGAWPTRGYIGYFDIVSKLVFGKIRMEYDIGAGDSLAGSGLAYTASSAGEKPATNSFTTGLTLISGDNTYKLRYSQDVWGPEEWHRAFGEAFDRLYQLEYARKIGEHVEIGCGYTGAREDDGKYLASELGEYDEIRAFISLSFGPVAAYFGGSPGPALSGEAPPSDNVAPRVSMKIQAPKFTPDGDDRDDTLPIELFASDENSITGWKVSIQDNKGRVIKVMSGDGEPPHIVDWDGTDDIYGKTVPEGAYNAVFEATDSYDNTAAAGPQGINVVIPAKVIIREVTREVKVTETERGLLVSLTSRVLFDSGKSRLKTSANKALEEVVKILNAYPENQISIEGHTDNTGGARYNQRLSEERAKSVEDYLVKKGVSRERITSMGHGKEKPAATNSTAAGREANRRVEVIILRKDSTGK
ncbi:MAG: OmpA family protein [Elusimicrobiota bacterium]